MSLYQENTEKVVGSIATTSTVVMASLLVLGIDYVSTALLGGRYERNRIINAGVELCSRHQYH